MYYIKSFEEDFATKSLSGVSKVTFQSADNIIKNKKIKPNTKSFGMKRRLSTTILSDNYTKTYRSQGIIFKTSMRPDYVLPFDLALLINAKKIVVHYYRIKNNLHIYYNHELIDGFEAFIFKNFNSLIKKFLSLNDVWLAVNKFRKQKGYSRLPKSKFRLVEYNEAVFERAIRIEPVALFGRSKLGRSIAKKYKMPYYSSAKDFFTKLKSEE